MDETVFTPDSNLGLFPPNYMDWDSLEESLLYQDSCWSEEIDHGGFESITPLPALQSFQIVIDGEPMSETALPTSEQQSVSLKQEEASSSSSSWVGYMVDAQKKSRFGYFSWDRDEGDGSNEEFKVTTQWEDEQEFGFEEKNGILLGWGQQNQPEENRALDDHGGGRSGRKTGERYKKKKRTKFHQTISLQVLQQYFAGSLKDAAKDIGVCPTTLKRICREHGIKRWPSRKIKKVHQSLKKLQRVIDSVHGAQGTIEIASFYSAFPELNSVADNMTTHELSSPATSQQSAESLTQTPNERSITGVCENAAANERPHADSIAAFAGVCENAAVNYMPCKSFVEGGGFRVKASLGEANVRLVLQPNWGLRELKQEIGKRFSVESIMCFKYLDEDGEWVRLSCDDDLEECKEMHRFLERNAIRVSLHHNQRF